MVLRQRWLLKVNNTICGFICTTIGEVIIDGINITKSNTIAKNVRALIENPKFISSISGYNNLKLLANINNTISDEQILKTIDLVGLTNEKDKEVSKYSLGMKQKLGIAQVLMEEPDIMIFDEPFNGLDNESAEKIRKIIIEEKNKGKLILIATHIKEDINKLCDEIFSMDVGKIIKNK